MVPKPPSRLWRRGLGDGVGKGCQAARFPTLGNCNVGIMTVRGVKVVKRQMALKGGHPNEGNVPMSFVP